MSQKSYEYDLFLPLTFDDGLPIGQETIEAIKKLLVERFGGVTDFKHQNEGLWKLGPVTYKDAILILRTLGGARSEARPFFEDLKEQLKSSLRQKDILIVEREVQLV